jgi:NAD(P)-dependent dehydrogenase (short-subunit alcohol dehydrogenase family)
MPAVKGIENSVAIVTGAGSGNGRAIALALAAEGARVICADIDDAGAHETAARIGPDARAMKADIRSDADCRHCAAAAQALDGPLILVNNAGVLVRGGILDLSEADWDRQFDINVKGAFLMTRAAAPLLRERGGCVVMVASIAGLRGAATHLAYSASKHALVGMTRSLALELAPQGVRVNAVCPGLVHTPMLGDVAGDLPQRVRAYPLGRLGQPEDVASVVVHLASDAAAWTTGLCYALDGGAGLGTRS